MQQPICIQNTDQVDIIKIQTFNHHLCSDQNIDAPLFKLLDQYIMRIFSAHRVHIHPGDPEIWKFFEQLLLNPFRTKVSLHKIMTAARRTCC